MAVSSAGLARPKSNCASKLQTHPLVREGDPHQKTHNCQTEKEIWSRAPDDRSLLNFNFNLHTQ
jgi:hypothetical protein